MKINFTIIENRQITQFWPLYYYDEIASEWKDVGDKNTDWLVRPERTGWWKDEWYTSLTWENYKGEKVVKAITKNGIFYYLVNKELTK